MMNDDKSQVKTNIVFSTIPAWVWTKKFSFNLLLDFQNIIWDRDHLKENKD